VTSEHAISSFLDHLESLAWFWRLLSSVLSSEQRQISVSYFLLTSLLLLLSPLWLQFYRCACSSRSCCIEWFGLHFCSQFTVVGWFSSCTKQWRWRHRRRRGTELLPSLLSLSVLQSGTSNPRGWCLQPYLCQVFFSFSCGSAGKDAQNVIKRFLNGSYFEEIYGADALRSSGKTIVLPKPVKFPLFSSALSHYYTENARFLAIQIMWFWAICD